MAFLMGTDEEKRRLLATVKYTLNNNEAAKYLTTDKFNRLTVTGMSVADWGKKFGGNAAKLASIMQSSHKVGIGFQGGREIEKMGGAAHLGVSKNYSQVLINEGSFPRETYGTMQWTDTTLAHELFGHALRTVGAIKEDVGSIHEGMRILHGINLAEADGMWAENNYRAAKGYRCGRTTKCRVTTSRQRIRGHFATNRESGSGRSCRPVSHWLAIVLRDRCGSAMERDLSSSRRRIRSKVQSVRVDFGRRGYPVDGERRYCCFVDGTSIAIVCGP
jgi:hypothetical protein